MMRGGICKSWSSSSLFQLLVGGGGGGGGVGGRCSCCSIICSSSSSYNAAHHPIPRKVSSSIGIRMSSSSSSGGWNEKKKNNKSSAASSAIDFLTLCHRLKSTKRSGWVRRGIENPESIADHMYRMGIMALISSNLPPTVDRDKCIKMAIVHDIAEAIVGDITPVDGVPKEEKSRKEQEALHYMCNLLGNDQHALIRAKEIHDLWMEYEHNSSPEAHIVKDFDKVEMILQALEYENEQGKDLDEFFRSTAGKFQTDVGKAWASEIASRRRDTGK